MSNRYIKLARKFFESEEWIAPRKFSEAEAWLDMVQLASFADHEITLSNGSTITLYRGEFYYTMRQLAKRWGWSLGGVQRYFIKLSEGANPRIERIRRDTRFDTPSDTQVDTEVIVVRLCNYNSYNDALSSSDTPSDTPSDTGFDTLKNKGILRIKGYNNTHTHYTELKDLFVRACWRVHESAEACEEACRTHEEICLLCQHDAQALAEHKALCQRDKLYNVMFSFYRYYSTLQCSFPKPLLPSQMQELLRSYDLSDVWRIMEAIDNKRESVKGNSLFKTVKQWATTDIVIAQRKRHQSTIN